MSQILLKPAAQIAALTTGKDHEKVEPKRRKFLAEKAAAAGDEIEHVLPALIAGATDDAEAAFLRALVTAPPELPPAPRSEEAESEAHV